MHTNTPLSALSLRTKLVLSYLFVIIGTVLVLSFVVSRATENYFINSQNMQLAKAADDWSYQLLNSYRLAGGGWDNAVILPRANQGSPYAFFGFEADVNTPPICSSPYQSPNNCDNAAITKILKQTLQGQDTPPGKLEVISEHGTSSLLYVSKALQLNGQTIGAIFVSETLASTSDFLINIDQAILITGCVVAGVALLFSFLLVRRLTRPLADLTNVANEMKRGEYTRRVAIPTKLDEMGLLGLTFNEMADTIEADVTELRQQDQIRRDLIANIAHDLATPLTAIQGFSEALADDVIADPAARQETAQRIAREVQRLRRLVSDVQHMTSLEAGRVKFDLAPLDMHALVDETIAVIEPECEHADISVQNEIAPETPLVLADSDRITQVLLNLLDNARRHTPQGGKLNVSAKVEGKQVRIAVSDTGSGIDPADLAHIFERFYRADRARTTSTGGSGLGLAIVKAIINAHGGGIWAESTPGTGTRITFTLPIVAKTGNISENINGKRINEKQEREQVV